MSGNRIGSLKKRTGFGKDGYTPGDMMREMKHKGSSMKCKMCGMKHDSMKHPHMKYKFDTGLIKDTIKGIPKAAGRLGKDTLNLLGYSGAQIAAPGAYKSFVPGIRQAIRDIPRALRGQSEAQTVPYEKDTNYIFDKSAKYKTKGIKKTGKSFGKSNKLGHGGRAAQLKARGVPGGVIGNLARATHAAKGQRNYHGK